MDFFGFPRFFFWIFLGLDLKNPKKPRKILDF